MNHFPGILTMLALLSLPIAGAFTGWHAAPHPGFDVEPPDLSQCPLQTMGARVGYRLPNDFYYESLAKDLHQAADGYYEAYGVFEGGTEETIDNQRFLVFTILAGYSMRADWCESPFDSPARPEPIWQES